MIIIDIPGIGQKQLTHLVLDYNGTLAVDGIPIDGISEKLNTIAAMIEIHVVTADTFGKAADGLKGVDCRVVIATSENQTQYKLDYIKALGCEKVCAIGNGANDAHMLKEAALGIALIQKEGAAAVTLASADIVCSDIHHALDLLLNPLRISATLRI